MKAKHIFIIIGIIIFLGLAAGVSLGTYQLFAVELASRPSVQFLQPLHEQSVSLGGSLVRFIARDKEGIEHVELWVDGELYASKKSELPQGSTPFPFVELWQPDSAGQHVLTARAYNSKNRDSVASVIVQVSNKAPVLTELPADLPLEVGAAEVPAPGDGVPPGDAGAEMPAAAEEEAGEYIPLLDDSIAIQPLEGFLSEPKTPILDMIPKIRLPSSETFEITSRTLEVEALYLETESAAYDGVFCYLSLAGSDKERIPEDDREYIHTAGGNLWNIKEALSGENKRIVILDEDTTSLKVELECWGAIFDAGAVYNLGTLYENHRSWDWDGHLIEQTMRSFDGWTSIGYEIRTPELVEGVLPAPYLYMGYGYTDTLGEIEYSYEYRDIIDGFIIQKDDTLAAVIDYPRLTQFRIGDTPYGSGDVSGPICGQSATYRVIAYQGDPITGTKSWPSNPRTFTSAPCYNMASVEFNQLYLDCLSGDDAGIFGDIECPNETGWMSDDRFVDAQCGLAGEDNYQDYMGCSYGTLYVNEQEIRVGEMGPNFGYCWRLADDSCYNVRDLSVDGNYRVWVPLMEEDKLLIGLNWYDADFDLGDSDDLQCEGAISYDYNDLYRIAAEPSHRKTYHRYFSRRGGGTCGMTYTIQVFQATPPSDE